MRSKRVGGCVCRWVAPFVLLDALDGPASWASPVQAVADMARAWPTPAGWGPTLLPLPDRDRPVASGRRGSRVDSDERQTVPTFLGQLREFAVLGRTRPGRTWAGEEGGYLGPPQCTAVVGSRGRQFDTLYQNVPQQPQGLFCPW